MSSGEELRALLTRWAEAVRYRDMRFLERLLAPEFTLTTGRRPSPFRGREEDLEITESRYVVEGFRNSSASTCSITARPRCSGRVTGSGEAWTASGVTRCSRSPTC